VVKGCDHYLGVQFVEGEERALGQTVLAKAKLVYDGIRSLEGTDLSTATIPSECREDACPSLTFDGVDYSALRAGTAFFLVEGAHNVGEGWVIERAEGSSG
jgi:hypothetical protein